MSQIPQLALEELKPTTQNLLAPLAGWTSHPAPLVHPHLQMLSNAVALARAAATVLLIEHYTSSLMVCTLYEIIFGGLNKDSPSLNRQWSRLYPNITVYSCPVV